MSVRVKSDDLANFEKGRIKALQDERLSIQKKTFTKWMNSFLGKVRLEVTDLFVDLADGRRLLKLLEIISGEKLSKPNNGKMRVHYVENVNKSLAFLHTKVRLESIGAEDIVDGNPRLILGLIWTIILRFQIQGIEINVDEDNAESSEKKSAKDALLLWCQRKTAGYPNVNIVDFSASWRSGLGFNALIHSHRPDLINYNTLSPSNHIHNLNNAFDVAEKHLQIPRLLDAEDIDCTRPDEKSVLTYVASYYHTFARMKNELKGGRRIANIIGQIIEAEKLKTSYELNTNDLLDWIMKKSKYFDEKKLPNSLQKIQLELIQFKLYRTEEKPPKYREKSEIEANFFKINIVLKELNQSSYTPPDGKLLYDIERYWERLEKSENRMEIKLKNELLRLTNLEELAAKFEKKYELRGNYLNDMINVLKDGRYGVVGGSGVVEAVMKKHEAISADIYAREDRCKQLFSIADYLQKENYEHSPQILQKSEKLEKTWNDLIALLKKHKLNLEQLNQKYQNLKQIENLKEIIKNLSQKFESIPNNYFECESLMEQFELNEVQVYLLKEVEGRGDEGLIKEYVELCRKMDRYRGVLRERFEYFRVLREVEEEVEWVEGKIGEVGVILVGLGGVKRVGVELKSIKEQKTSRADLQMKLFEQAEDHGIDTTELSSKIARLNKELELKEEKLRKLEVLNAFYQDCEEIQDFVREKMPLVESRDYGSDVPSALSLYQRAKDLVMEIESFKGDVENLKSVNIEGVENEIEITQEERLVPHDYYEEEEVLETEYKTFTEEREVPQVKALYPFTGQDNIQIQKGEVLFLLSKTNADWWNVRKSSGQDGFVPANYVKQIEPKLVLVQVRKPETVKKLKKTKKTKLVMETVTKKVEKKAEKIDCGEVVRNFQNLQSLAAVRLENLRNSILYHEFFSECADFEKWLLDKKFKLENEEGKDLEQMRKNFDKLFTDLSASTKRLEEISKLAEQLKEPEVREKKLKVHKLYDELNELKKQKEKSLEGASIVELFYRNCSELSDWIAEKEEAITNSFIKEKTIKALEKGNEQIEREILPLKEKFENLKSLAKDCIQSYPKEKSNISKKINELGNDLKDLNSKAEERKNMLEQIVGKEIFSRSFDEIKSKQENLKQKLNEKFIRDVNSVENELKNVDNFFTEVELIENDIDDLSKLGSKIGMDVNELKQNQKNLNQKLEEKKIYLEKLLDLLLFEKESDLIDKQIENFDCEVKNLEQVELGLKQLNEHFNKLEMLDERLDLFVVLSEKLESVHEESEKIKLRKQQTIDKRNKIKENSKMKKKELLNLREFYLFKRNVEEFEEWIDEKLEILDNLNHSELTNVDKKLKKHQQFVVELRANLSKLLELEKSCIKLVKNKNNGEQAQILYEDLKEKWGKLDELCDFKFKNLKKAEEELKFNKEVEDLKEKLKQIEKYLENKDLGSDRRSCKELLKKHELVESDLLNAERKLEQLKSKNGSVDSLNMINIDKYKKPTQDRKKALEQLLKFYDFIFEVDNEKNWIKEKSLLVDSISTPNDLYEANIKLKKIEIISNEVEKRANFNKLVKESEEMINHPEYKKIEKIINELKTDFKNLLEKVADKKKSLTQSLVYCEFLNDVRNLEQFLEERRTLIQDENYGMNKESSIKLLSKHKQIELEIDTYSDIIKELGVIKKENMHYDQMITKWEELVRKIESIKEEANMKRNKLLDAVNRHEFYSECEELIEWMGEVGVICESEEYGMDYEHLVVLRGRFEECKIKIINCEKRVEGVGEVLRRVRGEKMVEEGVYEGVCQKYSDLLRKMEAREEKIIAAGEIHRFNRDVSDTLERINEKLQEIPEEGGKDYNSCEVVLRWLENFENDLVVMEAGVQVLIDDATKLSTLYPTNAPNINEEKTLIIEQWLTLQNKTEQKKAFLQSQLDYFKFLSYYRDLSNFTTTTNKHLLTFETSDASILIQENENIKKEIEGKKEKFAICYDLSSYLNVQDKVQELKKMEQSLDLNYLKKKTYLDQLFDLQIFLREVNGLFVILSRQNYLLSQEDKSENVEEVEKSLKKHENLENVLVKQNSKFELNEGLKLIEQNHFKKDLVREKIEELRDKRKKVIELSIKKRKELEDKLEKMLLVQNAEETLKNLEQKQKELENLNKNVKNLEEKIKKLKRYKKFEAELNKMNVDEIIQKIKPIDVQLYEKLCSKYEELQKLSLICGKGLEEAQEILEYENLLEKLEKLIKSRELLTQISDTGKDFEHCEEILKTLELDQVDDESLIKINEIALKLGFDNRELNERYGNLKKKLDDYKNKLEEALKYHKFNKESNELNLRINEKIPLVSVEELGQSLEAVQSFKKKQDFIENEMKLIENKLNELESSPFKNDSLIAVDESWKNLNELSKKRRNNLKDAHLYFKFLEKLRQIESFVEVNVNKLDKARLPNNLKECNELSEEFSRTKKEIEEKKEQFDQVRNGISLCLKDGNLYESELVELGKLLNGLEVKLNDSLTSREEKLKNGIELQNFFKLVGEAELVLSELELICKYYLGDELKFILKMLKKIEESEYLLRKSEGKVIDVEKFGLHLVDSDHFNIVKESTQNLKEKYSNVEKLYKEKLKFLKDSKEYLLFNEEKKKLCKYLQEKLQISNEDNYSDMTNLQSKIQKHQAFEQEFKIFESKCEDFMRNKLNENCFREKIDRDFEELTNSINELRSSTQNKKKKLYQSYQALSFFNNLEDFESIFKNFDEKPDSLSHCKYLLKKYLEVEENYKVIETFNFELESFKLNYLYEKIEKSYYDFMERFREFGVELRSYLEYLRVELKMFEKLKEIDEMREIIKDYSNSVDQIDCNFNELEKNIKKLDSIENEMKNLVIFEELKENEKNLVKKIESKKIKLKNALKTRKYFETLNELDYYIKEKNILLNMTDYGHDEESVLKLTKKFENTYANLNGFNDEFDKLTQIEEYEDLDNYEEIKEKTKALKEKYSNLQKAMDILKQKLQDNAKLFKYLNDSDELIEWIETQMSTAGSEDYGRDVEHVEILITKFESFLKSVLNVGEQRLEHLSSFKSNLIELKHPECAKIEAKFEQVVGVFEEFKELSQARSDALLGAKQVHIFDRTVEETMDYVNEKLFRIDELFIEDNTLQIKVENIKKEAEELSKLFPDAEEHILCKLDELVEIWNFFLKKLEEKKKKEKLDEKLAVFFNQYEDYLGYLVDLCGRSEGIALSNVVEQAGVNFERICELINEFGLKKKLINDFIHEWKLFKEVEESLRRLEDKLNNTEAILKKKKDLLEQNYDLQKFNNDLINFDILLKSVELNDEQIDSVREAEESLSKFEDIEIFAKILNEKKSLVERKTLIENIYKELQKNQKEEEKKNKFEELKRIEIERIKNEREEQIPRSSSFRLEVPKKARRTPSFTTRRRTTSFRKIVKLDDPSLPPVSMDGYLERKHELLSGNKRATNRSWKSFYTVLCGQLLCFFKDQEDFLGSRPAACSPLNVYQCSVEGASDYIKKKHVFRLKIFDGSEFLFAAESGEAMEKWVGVVGEVGKLEPVRQLDCELLLARHSGNDGDHESESEDELQKPRSREPIVGNVASRVFEPRSKPPIPPRSSSIKDFVDAPRSSGSLPAKHHHDSSSESDSPKSNKKRGSTGLMGLFKRKKATQL